MNNPIIIVQRKEGIAQAAPQRHTSLRKAAEALSLRNVDQAVCELFCEALMRLVDLAYEEDAGGFCNIDRVTCKVLIPLPWGRAGHKRWALRPQEAVLLREIMQRRQQLQGLFLYDGTRHSWHLNLKAYATRDDANAYLTRYPVAISELRRARIQRGAG